MTREEFYKLTDDELIENYPFLQVKDEDYYGNWSNCWKDDFENGWWKAFGYELCEELKQAIEEDKDDTFMFLQIKEKYASLRMYCVYNSDKINEIIAKYSELSKYICGHCGKRATKITKGWYYPFCDNCIKDVLGGYSDIETYYGFDSPEDLDKEIDKIKNHFIYSDYWGTLNHE